MDNTLLLLLLICPLVGFLINLSVGKKIGRSLVGIIGTTTVCLSFCISLFYFVQILSTKQAIQIHFFDWISLQSLSLGFDLILDQLSLLWLLFVTGIGALIHIYSIGYMKDDENIDRYFAYLNLFIFFMILLVTAGNLGIMFIGWEGVGLCSYLLIGFWYKNQKYNDAAKKAFIMNRIGDLGFLVGLFTLVYLFNTTDFASLKLALITTTDLKTTSLLGVAAFALFIGAIGKSAQIPLYTWLPDAMAGPTPVSALMHAATMVTAGIFMLTRLNFLFDLTPNVRLFIAIIGAVTSLFAASIGIAQNDIKKVLAYSTISQLGLMFMAIGLGAYHVAVFHVITHAFFKACLFLGAGSVIHSLGGEQDMTKMGGLRKFMPITFYTFLVSTLSISGIPPFAGFFSKDEILLTAFQNNIFLWILAALASLLTAFYMFRVLFLTFYNNFRGTEEQKKHLHESPKTMTIPLVVLAALAIVGGFISIPGYSWLNTYIEPVIVNLQSTKDAHGMNSMGWALIIVSILIACVGLGIAYYKYMTKSELPMESKDRGFVKLLRNGYYVNEVYDILFVKPIYWLAGFFRNIIEKFISGVVLAFGQGAKLFACCLSLIQNGNINFYLIVFVLAFCSIITLIFLM